MDLLDKLTVFEGGHVVNLERGNFMGIFIGRLDHVGIDENSVILNIVETRLYRLNGQEMNAALNYQISWNRKVIVPYVPVETTKRLATFLPYIGASLVFYPRDESRPTFEQAILDLKNVRYL
jgi:hypothetical protein